MVDNEPFGSESTWTSPDPSVKRQVGVNPPGVSTVPSSVSNTAEESNKNCFLSSDYHLTVQLRVHLERRQVSLLMSILCYQAVHFGVTFPMYLSMLHLLEILMGQKTKPGEIRDKYERLSVLLSRVIIRDLAGKDLNFSDPVSLTEQTRELLLKSKGLITKDTYRSRFTFWRPERFLRLKTVPVDVVIERNGNSVRFSSYCKGYGEGTGTARRGKTPTSFELDGEDTPEWILSQNSSDKELAREVFLQAHFEWLKRFGAET